jgi:integrase
MSRAIHKLSAVFVDKTHTRGYHSDGGKLYLQVSNTGSKSWIFRCKQKRREMGLGSYTEVSLKQAREIAADFRKLENNHIDPYEHRQAQKTAQILSEARTLTFSACSEAYIKARAPEWKSPKHRQQWENTLKEYCKPINKLAVADVDTPLVMRCLEPIWTTKTETATRVRGRIKAILDWATTHGYRTGENPARWDGHLANLLAKPSKVMKVVHHPALPFEELPDFLQLLKTQDSIGARLLEFTIQTAARSGESRKAVWSEINMGQQVWKIPAERMKAGREHRVPLNERAVAILQQMEEIRTNDWVFPSTHQGKCMSDMSLTMLLRRMDRKDITVHGFRSTFRDWCAEKTSFPNIVAEQALAHSIGNQVEKAYRRGDLFEKRRSLMDQWWKYTLYTPVTKVAFIHS